MIAVIQPQREREERLGANPIGAKQSDKSNQPCVHATELDEWDEIRVRMASASSCEGFPQQLIQASREIGARDGPQFDGELRDVADPGSCIGRSPFQTFSLSRPSRSMASV